MRVGVVGGVPGYPYIFFFREILSDMNAIPQRHKLKFQNRREMMNSNGGGATFISFGLAAMHKQWLFQLVNNATQKTLIRRVNHCGGEQNCHQSRGMQSTILHQMSNIVCGIVGDTKSVNNVAYKAFIVKSITNHLLLNRFQIIYG